MPALLRGSQELAAVLAAVAVGGGLDVSGTCSRLTSVSSSFDGVTETSGSSKALGSGVNSAVSTGVGSEIGSSGSLARSSVGSSGLGGSVGL